MSEIFLTGATGFVGRHLAPKLLAAGQRARCLVRSLERAQSGGTFVVGDLLQPHSWQDSLSGVEVLIHLASRHRGPLELIRRTNAAGTALLVHAAQRARVRKFLYLSTLTASPRPSWPYAYSTWLAEQAIQQSSLDYTILRCSVIVGPGDPFLGGIMQCAQTWPFVPIVGAGKTKFQPISVGDVARCLADIVTKETHARELLTIGGPEIVSYEQIINTVLETLQLKKRKIHLPQRATRWLVRRLERWGIHTPFAPGHFLSRDHVASSSTVIAEEFGFTPQKLREVLADIAKTTLAHRPPNLIL